MIIFAKKNKKLSVNKFFQPKLRPLITNAKCLAFVL